MSHRKPPLPDSMRRPSRAGWCRWCGSAIVKDGKPVPRLKWHPACVEEFRLIHWPASTRAAVFARDHGICARCGVDTARQERIVSETLRLQRALGQRMIQAQHPFGMHWSTMIDGRRAAEWLEWQLLEFCRERGWTDPGAGAAPWQADHIRPLKEAEGRKEFWLLDNLQTLCHRCHVQKGKEDNARRRKARDPQAALPL